MGNCLRHRSAMHWGGDDWGSPESDGFFVGERRRSAADKDSMEMEEQGLLGEDRSLGFSSNSSSLTARKSSTEVKVKITKKQLEELLGKVDLKELSVQQVLAQLIDVSDRYEAHQRSWRPALQSIPEVN